MCWFVFDMLWTAHAGIAHSRALRISRRISTAFLSYPLYSVRGLVLRILVVTRTTVHHLQLQVRHRSPPPGQLGRAREIEFAIGLNDGPVNSFPTLV
jgi:hypothetical protein